MLGHPFLYFLVVDLVTNKASMSAATTAAFMAKANGSMI
jgi:hypothetical protein